MHSVDLGCYRVVFDVSDPLKIKLQRAAVTPHQSMARLFYDVLLIWKKRSCRHYESLALSDRVKLD